MEYAGYRYAIQKEDSAENDPLLMRILTARSKLDIPPQTPRIEQPPARPDQGHPSGRAEFSYGYEDDQQYFQLSLRPALHDLLDPPGGYIDGAEIAFLDATGRYYVGDNRLVLESLDFIDIVSIPARDRFIKPLSWKANVGLQRMQFDDDDRPLTGSINAGVGLSYEFWQEARLFLFAEAMAVISDRFDGDLALGAGPSAGLIWELTEKWRMALGGRALPFVLGDTCFSYEISLDQAIDLTSRTGLRIRLAQKQEFGSPYSSVSAGYVIYF